MITITSHCNDQIIKFDDAKGTSWLLSDDDDGNPEWVEIKDRTNEEEK